MPGGRSARLDLSTHFNNAGIAPDGRPGAGGLDGMGTVFGAESLPAPGATIVSEGTPFLFPGRDRESKDNIACEAQEIPLPPGAWDALHVLGMCDWRAFEEPLRFVFDDDLTLLCLPFDVSRPEASVHRCIGAMHCPEQPANGWEARQPLTGGPNRPLDATATA